MNIKHLKHENIDYLLWDKIIAEADNSIIYAFSWFLDCVTPDWEALVCEDYEYVMPLPVKKKFGIKYIVQPILTQQLGIFSSKPITENILKDFIYSIPCLSYEINLNEKNNITNSITRPNFILNLNVDYENLNKGFSVNTTRNIRKAENNNLKVEWDLHPNEFLQFYFNEKKHFNLPDKTITQSVINNAIQHNSIQLIGVKTLEDSLISALGLFISNKRLIYLLPSSNTNGRNKSAMFFLVNEIVKKNAGTDKILDFEGSKIDGVSRFYSGFGAKPSLYFIIKRFRPKILIGI